MAISAINNIAQTSFTGKIKTSKNGNQYEKTNSGKKVLPGIVAAAWAAGGLILGRGNLEATKGWLTVLGLKAIPSMATAFLAGAIIDGLRNKHARKSADKVAQLNAQA